MRRSSTGWRRCRRFPRLIDQFVAGPTTGEAVNEATAAFKKALLERALGAESSHHLRYPSGATKPEASGANQRNGRSAKTVLPCDGPLRIEVPRDREGSFEPALIPKHEPRPAREDSGRRGGAQQGHLPGP
ncbi:transposase-like protein [Variovorax boronicumulans]|nr:transposase-like protein [Variovorax boronicumulans]